MPPPVPDIATGPVSLRVVIVLSERNACVPTEETVRLATVTLAASVTSLSASPKTTVEAALGTPAAPESDVVHIAASVQAPAPPFQV